VRIAVVIPSRLAPNPLAEGGRLYLHRAVSSVRRQTVASAHEIKIVVGLSHPAPPTPSIDGVQYVVAVQPGQAMALNAAVASAVPFDALAFLEDDDHWADKRLEYGLAALAQGFDFVSSNQREVDVEGNFVRVNDFATCSGQIMTRACWEAVGPFDPSFKWHLDTEWLGRLNASGRKRLHLVEHGADVNPRPWLRNVMQFSKAATTTEREPLVTRTVNPEGGMARIAKDPIAAAESQDEHRRMFEKFGGYPW